MIYEIILRVLYYTMYNHKTLISVAKSKLLYRSKFQELCSLRCRLYNLLQYRGIAPILYLSHVEKCFVLYPKQTWFPPCIVSPKAIVAPPAIVATGHSEPQLNR